MRTGVSYMGHHNPRYLDLDLCEMKELRLDEVLLCVQENDFTYFPGKLEFTPRIAREYGIRPLAIIWGALNLFGGGRSSQFLLENPSGFQVARDGGHLSAGCYVNPLCVARIEAMIDELARRGFAGYFVDEPTPLRDCYCPACRARFADWYGGDLLAASEEQGEVFRQRCVVAYVEEISRYCKVNHPQLETICCLMPHDDAMWQAAAQVRGLDNLGTDIYWVNETRAVEEMTPIVRRMAALCRESGKTHHEWLQCWQVEKECEPRIGAQGEILVREQPDALYVWAWKGQIGTAETCADPLSAWQYAERILRLAKDGQ